MISHKVSVLHVPNAASGGHKTDFELDAFLIRHRGSPQCHELLRLTGTVVEGGQAGCLKDPRARSDPPM